MAGFDLRIDAGLAALRPDDLARDVEAETDSLAASAGDAEELVEDTLPVFRRDPRSLIAHLEPHLRTLGARAHFHPRAGLAVPDGIADQVVEDQRDPVAIGEGQRL